MPFVNIAKTFTKSTSRKRAKPLQLIPKHLQLCKEISDGHLTLMKFYDLLLKIEDSRPISLSKTILQVIPDFQGSVFIDDACLELW